MDSDEMWHSQTLLKPIEESEGFSGILFICAQLVIVLAVENAAV
jgi:hypothetical protein